MFCSSYLYGRCYSRNGQKGDDNGGDGGGFIEWFNKQQNKTLKWHFIGKSLGKFYILLLKGMKCQVRQ